MTRQPTKILYRALCLMTLFPWIISQCYARPKNNKHRTPLVVPSIRIDTNLNNSVSNYSIPVKDMPTEIRSDFIWAPELYQKDKSGHSQQMKEQVTHWENQAPRNTAEDQLRRDLLKSNTLKIISNRASPLIKDLTKTLNRHLFSGTVAEDEVTPLPQPSKNTSTSESTFQTEQTEQTKNQKKKSFWEAGKIETQFRSRQAGINFRHPLLWFNNSYATMDIAGQSRVGVKKSFNGPLPSIHTHYIFNYHELHLELQKPFKETTAHLSLSKQLPSKGIKSEQMAFSLSRQF